MAPLVDVRNEHHDDESEYMNQGNLLPIVEATTALLLPPNHETTVLNDEVHRHQQQQKKEKKKETKQRRKKKISFAEYAELYYVPNIDDDMSDEEFVATYMQDSDYDRIHDENMSILQEMMKKISTKTIFSDYQDCYRGLEIRLPQAMAQKIQRVSYFRNAILQHQEESFDGQIQSEWIESWFSRAVAPFAIAAQWRAAIDCQSVFADDLNEHFHDDDMIVQQQNDGRCCTQRTPSSKGGNQFYYYFY